VGLYSATVSNVTFNTAADSMTLTPAANRRIQLIDVSIGGMGTASAANELGIFPATTVGVTGSGGITPWALSGDGLTPAASATVFTAWATQPVVGQQMFSIPCNSNGGLYRYKYAPDQPFYAVGLAAATRVTPQISFRAKVGTGTISMMIVWMEDPL
jgi:hypothetical protein